MDIRIAAICPSLDRADLVRQLVTSYRATAPQPPPELVIVAQGPDDGTVGWCEHHGVTVLRSETPLTFAQANNLAVKQIDADWLLLLNNDLILQPGFWDGLAQMIGLNYDVVGAKLLYPDGRIQHCGKWLTLDGYPFHVLRYQPADHEMARDIRPFPLVSFACVAIRKAVWDSLGGLDEQFVNGYEDDDFCLRARECGAQIGVHPGMLAVHLESQTTGHDTANKEAQWVKFRERWIASGRVQWATGVYQGWRQ